MTPFRYLRADSVAEAVQALADNPRAAVVAGGTNLLDLMKRQVSRPPLLVDIQRLPLDTVTTDDQGLHIGALVRNSDLARHPRVQQDYPLLAQALLSGASPQLRNMATVGGNLLQRTRCPYFRDPHGPCNKRRPGSGCAALTGEQRGQAVLGVSDRCIAAHPSDMCTALAALAARVHLTGPAGERSLDLSELYRQPGDTPERETNLRPGELITGITLPPLPFARRSLYRKARDRAEFAFALVAVAVALDRDGDRVRQARIALGGLASMPWRSLAAEQALRGQPATRHSYRQAADAALTGATPQPGNAFKIDLCRRLLVQTLVDLSNDEASL